MHNCMLGGNNSRIRDNVIGPNCLKMSSRGPPIIYLNGLIMGGYEEEETERQEEEEREDEEEEEEERRAAQAEGESYPLCCCRLIIFRLDGRPCSTPG